MARAAIRLEGQGAERRFLELVPGSRNSDKAGKGDAIVSVDGLDAYVEIKECHAQNGCNGTINQVRAIKYISCVICAPNHGCWYVISPDQLVGIAATKSRGQHTEIPFESMNFGLSSIPSDLHTKCSDEELGRVVQEAIRRGRRRTDIIELLERMRADISTLKDRYRDEVRELL